MNNINFGNTKISYDLIRYDSEDYVTLSMSPNKGLIVKAPQGLNKEKVEELILKKAKWIIEKKSLINELVKMPIKKEFMSGENIQYLGRNYRLKILNSEQEKVKLYRGKLFVKTNNKKNSEQIKEQIIKWYKKHAKKKIKERIKIYEKKLDVTPEKIRIRKFNKRWASCTKGKKLNFNWKIIMAPMRILDYVIVHELCHLKINKHSKLFWQKVSTIIPDYKKRKEWLRINGPKLDLI